MLASDPRPNRLIRKKIIAAVMPVARAEFRRMANGVSPNRRMERALSQ